MLFHMPEYYLKQQTQQYRLYPVCIQAAIATGVAPAHPALVALDFEFNTVQTIAFVVKSLV